ncbi:MAG: rhomboid family intramembrane serine protease [Alphaproteobacteria bacterium]|jgi:membrane associated rhomboid family serine protease|nr:rhomboid family intramembrane serine protease [Alphaproteobacteria bacterium]MDP6515667.1 rhomboid family intramembrane serine protease [Alphaproteobacteria bacterium]
MFPLHDDNPTRIRPVVTIGLIVACALVFLWQLSLPADAARRAIYSLGVIPAVLIGPSHLPDALHALPAPLTVISSMFLHGGWMHVIGNMLYLWIFGNNVEDAMGHGRFAAFYVLCGVAGALAQSLAAPASEIPMIGASGAIAGVLGAYLLLHPGARVRCLVFLGFFMTFVRLPAALVLGGWIVIQLISAAGRPADAGGVAFLAHIGGFAAGLALIGLFKYRHVPFFDGRLGRARGAHGRRRGPWD